MANEQRWVCFSHGKESGPWGTKINALAERARLRGWQVESLDYQGMDDPDARVARLEEWCVATPEPFVLVGSSMGGHVAAAAATGKGNAAQGLFLLAPAFYVTGYEQHTPPTPECPVTIVHGWNDDVISWRNSACFAEPCGARLVLLNDGHRLGEKLEQVIEQFDLFLSVFEGE